MIPPERPPHRWKMSQRMGFVGGLNAYCTSQKCAPLVYENGKRKKSANIIPRPKIKKVPRGTLFCPDCECALFWQKIGDKNGDGEMCSV